MTSKKILVAALISASFATQSFASEIIENRSVKNFYGIIVNSDADIILSQGNQQFVKVVAAENEMASVKTEVENGVLIIRREGTQNSAVKIYVCVSDINLLEMNGNGRISEEGMIN